MMSQSEDTKIETPVIEPAAPVKRTDRDTQRSALRDLVDLATDCAATETEIESRLAAVIAASASDLERARAEIQQKFESLRSAAQQKYDERLAAAQGQFDYERSSISQTDHQQRSRVA